MRPELLIPVLAIVAFSLNISLAAANRNWHSLGGWLCACLIEVALLLRGLAAP